MNEVSLYTLPYLLDSQQTMEHFLYAINENVVHLAAPPILTHESDHRINMPDVIAFSEKEVWLIMIGHYYDTSRLPMELAACAAQGIVERETVNVIAIVEDVPWDKKQAYSYIPLAPRDCSYASVPAQGVHNHVFLLPGKHSEYKRNALAEMQQLLDALSGKDVNHALPLLELLRNIPYEQQWDHGVRYSYKSKHKATYTKYVQEAKPYPEMRALISASTFIESFERDTVRTVNSAAPLLASKGKSAEEISSMFHVPLGIVKQILADTPWESSIYEAPIPKIESLPLTDDDERCFTVDLSEFEDDKIPW